MEGDEFRGSFWSPEDGRRSQGVLKRTNGFDLDLASDIVTSLTYTRKATSNGATMMTVSMDPKLVVADFEPRVIFGELEDGSLVTFVDAHLNQQPFNQSFSGHRVLWGGHVDAEQEYQTVRFMAPSGPSWSGLKGTANCAGSKPEGSVTGYIDKGDLWIEFNSAQPMSLATQESLLWHSATTLMGLWCNATLQPTAVEVRVSNSDSWLRLDTTGLSKKVRPIRDPLLPLAQLSIATLAQWLSFAATISPVHYIVAPGGLGTGSIQSHVLALASALEGLHRRTHHDQNLFHSLRPAEVKSVRAAALKAATARLVELGFEDLEGAEVSLRLALNHIGQVTLAQRLQPFAAQAHEIAPGLVGPSVDAWIRGVKGARNNEGHQLESVPEFGAEKFDPYYQYLISARWVAHIALLVLVSVPPSDIKLALARHTRFAYDLANIDTSRLGWEGSSLDTFRAACESTKHPADAPAKPSQLEDEAP